MIWLGASTRRATKFDVHEIDVRGRTADVPEAIPVKGLRDVLWRVVHEVSSDRVMLISAGVTFYVLLAIFPALASLVALYGLIADPSTMADHLNVLATLLPPGSFEIVADRVASLAASRDRTLGLTFFAGLTIALWSTRNGILALFDAMNVAYDEDEKRGFFKRNLIGLAFTVGGITGLTALIGVVAVFPAILAYLWLDGAEERLLLILRWPILLVLAFAAVTCIYRYGPSRSPARLRWLTWGAALTVTAWIAMSAGFSFYLRNFADYDAAYGAFGALMGLLVWTWLSVGILIVGAELNAELEHQTARDTTTGPPRPMGARGAFVADTLGATADERKSIEE
ncbi:YihY/virulence factor BrkB family protein [Shinella sp. G-2]